ncbi:hypothetical protein PR202_ga30263 [Eleusine coracana subsp. coracana]|uniref:Uncharacterized protein n=1 Tax=Eleusine coracana subsp. coracana TaxID=191504 RepID=A0AAV5DNI2_ELECO|nr:hypothetical protein PR202_ga30263 [Eleusine coracana subsp. coracana]
MVSGTTHQGLNSVIILGAWTLWKNQNDCVFNKVAPSMTKALILAGEETRLWCMAGAKALASLTRLV